MSPTSSSGRRTGPFAYRDYGNLATIGRKQGRDRLGRRPAQRLPRLADLVASPTSGSWSASAAASPSAISWLWNYLTYQRSARLITGEIAGRDRPNRRRRKAA